MNIYLAGSYGRLRELARYASALKAMGHGVTARWLQGLHEADDDNHTVEQAREWSTQDLEDIDAADTFVVFTGPGRRGGRHTELGYALARMRRESDSDAPFAVYAVGPAEENIFYYTPDVCWAPDFATLIAYPEFVG